MLYCPLCNESIIIVSSLCSDCKSIRQMMNLYSKQAVISICEDVLLRKKLPQEIQQKVKKQAVKYATPENIETAEIEELD